MITNDLATLSASVIAVDSAIPFTSPVSDFLSILKMRTIYVVITLSNFPRTSSSFVIGGNTLARKFTDCVEEADPVELARERLELTT